MRDVHGVGVVAEDLLVVVVVVGQRQVPFLFSPSKPRTKSSRPFDHTVC